MLLTGFDSQYLNTLYVDKRLKYHNLIQAVSRTNRVLNDSKPYGNILDFRGQQKAVDEAIALFSGVKAEQARTPQAAPVPQGRVVGRPVRRPVARPRDVVPAVSIGFEGQAGFFPMVGGQPQSYRSPFPPPIHAPHSAMAGSASRIMLPNGRCAVSPLAGSRGCSPAAIAAATGPRRCTR